MAVAPQLSTGSRAAAPLRLPPEAVPVLRPVGRPRRRQVPIALLAVFVLGWVGAVGFAVLLSHQWAYMGRLGRVNQDLRRLVEEAQRQNQALTREKTLLSSLERVEARARELGMRYPAPQDVKTAIVEPVRLSRPLPPPPSPPALQPGLAVRLAQVLQTVRVQLAARLGSPRTAAARSR